MYLLCVSVQNDRVQTEVDDDTPDNGTIDDLRCETQPALPLCWDSDTTLGQTLSAPTSPPASSLPTSPPASSLPSTTPASSLPTGYDEVRLNDEPEVEVRTSTRRRKTATAYWEGNHIVVVLPAHVRGSQRSELIEWLVKRARSRRPGASASDEMLAQRAAVLADRYLGGIRPSSIRWVTNQSKRWGSCSSHSEEIRISHRLQVVPDWVLDAILVHELAHLVHPDHSESFCQMANRYPRQDEASIYLDGFALGLEQS